MTGLVVNRQKAELFAAALLAGIGGFFVVFALRLPPPDEAGVPGPGTVPLILGTVIVAGALALAFEALRSAGRENIDLGGRRQGIALLSLVLGTAFFEVLGFMLATFLFLSVGYKMLGGAPWIRATPAAAMVSAILWLTFTKLLGVGLPYGLIGEILFR